MSFLLGSLPPSVPLLALAAVGCVALILGVQYQLLPDCGQCGHRQRGASPRFCSHCGAELR